MPMIECNERRSAMARIPAGEFFRGDPSGGPFERPVKNVFVSAFEIDITPVTNAAFAEFVDATGHRTDAERCGTAWGHDGTQFRDIAGLHWRSAAAGRDDHPVVFVSWDDAAAYAQWASKRLPSEAEWERAARGTLAGAVYPWGDAAPDGTQCNFARPPAVVPPTTPVRAFPPNGYGLYDMVGNVWQWCADWYATNAYEHDAGRDPTGPADGTHRVRRGASWNVIQAFRLRCANRGAATVATTVPNVGFRCAR